MIGPTALIPIHDENPTRSFSLLTVALIAVNVLVFFVEPNLGVGTAPRLVEFFYRWGLVPKEITSGSPVTLPGCAGPCLPDKSVYLSLITSMFLHGGPLHLIGNMLFLWIFGNNVEDTLGRVRYFLFYFIAGIAASIAHVAANPDSVIPTVGASGAVSAALGAYIILFPRARVTTIVPAFLLLYTMRLPAVAVLGIWFVSQFFIGASQQLGGAGVAWVAHVGGFLSGAVLILLFGGRRRARRGREHFHYEEEN